MNIDEHNSEEWEGVCQIVKFKEGIPDKMPIQRLRGLNSAVGITDAT